MHTSHTAMRLVIALTTGLLSTTALADPAVDPARQTAQEKQRVEAKVVASDEYLAISAKLADLQRKLDDNGATPEDRQKLSQRNSR